jgi:predicted nucleotidyltransferase
MRREPRDVVQRTERDLVPLPVAEGSVEALLPEAVQRIADALHPEKIVQKIVLFGSYASGAPTGDSDVDLLVVLDQPGSRSERYLAVASLLRPRRFPVDLIIRTPAEIEHALAHGDFFIREILTRGRVLYERRP